MTDPSEQQGQSRHDGDDSHRLDKLDHALEQRRTSAQLAHHLLAPGGRRVNIVMFALIFPSQGGAVGRG